MFLEFCHPSSKQILCFISNEKKKKKKKERKRCEREGETSTCGKFLFRAVHETRFLRAGEGPKNTKAKKKLLCFMVYKRFYYECKIGILERIFTLLP